eukprot:COSAG02_NODE_6340_length_3640_cov_1.447614_2_plen_155_part_00
MHDEYSHVRSYSTCTAYPCLNARPACARRTGGGVTTVLHQYRVNTRRPDATQFHWLWLIEELSRNSRSDPHAVVPRARALTMHCCLLACRRDTQRDTDSCAVLPGLARQHSPELTRRRCHCYRLCACGMADRTGSSRSGSYSAYLFSLGSLPTQ